MRRAIDARLRKLEAGPPEARIPVFCRSEAEFDATVTQLAVRGVHKGSDRPRLAMWSDEPFATERGEFERQFLAWLDGGPSPTPSFFGTHHERLAAGWYGDGS